MLALFSRNLLALTGAAIATTASASWVFFLTARVANPYSGIFLAGILPAALLIGLLLVPLGLWRERQQSGRWPEVNWRRVAAFAAVTTAVNLLILAHSGYRVVHYMDSASFCGQTCHTPMEPQFAAYRQGPHARVDCVRCHVEPSAAGYFRAKMNGTHQAIAALTGTFARPVRASADIIPDTARTCEGCHGAASVPAERLRVIPRFSDDEKPVPKPSVIVMHTRKIHAMHSTGGAMAMACTECHSRPAHRFESPEDAVDRALDAGEISPSLPFARAEAIKTLRESTTASAAALRFGARYSGSEEARRSAAAVQAIHARNVFPAVNVTWGTYINRLGHDDGCFRCHDGQQAGQDCSTCHVVLSMDEANPKILTDLGLASEGDAKR